MAGARDQPGEVTDRNALVQNANRAVAEGEVGAAGMKSKSFGRALGAIVGMRKRRPAKIFAVGAIQRAGARQNGAVIGRAIDAEIRARARPTAPVDPLRWKRAELLASPKDI